MNIRRALIVGCPGTLGARGYLAGAKHDLNHYGHYLRSIEGGAWEDEEEVRELMNPTWVEFQGHLDWVMHSDYTFLAFSGHGDQSATDGVRVQFFDGMVIPVKNFLRAKRMAVIVDACRNWHDSVAIPQTKIATLDGLNESFDRNRARSQALFWGRVAVCPVSPIIVHSCSAGEGAGDDEHHGGHYTFSLLDAARRQAIIRSGGQSRDMVMDLAEAHSLGTAHMHELYGQRQTPQFEGGRNRTIFPFAISLGKEA